MGRLYRICLFLLFLTGIFSAENDVQESDLISAQIIFRHGQRVPDTSFSKSTGVLTEAGKKQMFDLGRYIRQRYQNFIGASYDPEEILIISSDTDRTMRSAGLAAYGLFMEQNSATAWNDSGTKLFYEPIPVRTIPAKLDRFLQPQVNCPRFNQLILETVAVWLGDLIKNNQDLINIYIKERQDDNLLNTNVPGTQRLEKLIAFMEELHFKSNNGFPMETWEQSMIERDDFRYFLIGLFQSLYILPEERKLYGGSLLGLVVDGFHNTEMKKMVLYAGHDRSMYALMRLLDIYDPLARTGPPLGSALIFELRGNLGNTQEHIKFYFRNNTQVEPYEVAVDACGNPCFLSDFLNLTLDLIPRDYENDCRI